MLVLAEFMLTYSLSKLQYFGYLSIGKDLVAGKDWRQKDKSLAEDEMLDSISDPTDMNLSKLREILKDREAWSAAVCGVAKSQKQLSYWTEL